jgi:hypothetical protein
MKTWMFIMLVLKHCQNSPTKVKYLFSGLNITDVAVAELRDSIVVSGPHWQHTTPVCEIDQNVCISIAGLAALAELPEKGKISSFTISVLLGKEWIVPQPLWNLIMDYQLQAFTYGLYLN